MKCPAPGRNGYRSDNGHRRVRLSKDRNGPATVAAHRTVGVVPTTPLPRTKLDVDPTRRATCIGIATVPNTRHVIEAFDIGEKSSCGLFACIAPPNASDCTHTLSGIETRCRNLRAGRLRQPRYHGRGENEPE